MAVKKKTIPAGLKRRIEEINVLIEKANKSNDIPSSDFGSTLESEVDLKPIKVSNQFVTIEPKYAGRYGYPKERFNVNREWDIDSLKYDLRYIKAALKKVL